MTAIQVVHHVLFRPGAMVIVAGPVERQSGEFLAKVARFLRILGVAWKRDGLNEHSMVMPNGSRPIPADDQVGSDRKEEDRLGHQVFSLMTDSWASRQRFERGEQLFDPSIGGDVVPDVVEVHVGPGGEDKATQAGCLRRCSDLRRRRERAAAGSTCPPESSAANRRSSSLLNSPS